MLLSTVIMHSQKNHFQWNMQNKWHISWFFECVGQCLKLILLLTTAAYNICTSDEKCLTGVSKH